ncbi:MAG: hypothetical protein WCA32_01750 [Chromatiaceae bacterium]
MPEFCKFAVEFRTAFELVLLVPNAWERALLGHLGTTLHAV